MMTPISGAGPGLSGNDARLASNLKVTVGIPEKPTAEDIERILSLLTLTDYVTIEDVWTNIEECFRLRGTPGEPIPHFENRMFQQKRVVWVDKVPKKEEALTMSEGAAWHQTLQDVTIHSMLAGPGSGKSNMAMTMMHDLHMRRVRGESAKVIYIDTEWVPDEQNL